MVNALTRRSFIGLTAASLAVSPRLLVGDESRSKTNVIVILVDDMGYSDLGCSGSEIPTPNIDRLANDGMRFTQFYNTGKCEPTRSALLSGLYHPEVGVGALEHCMTLGEAMQQAGYFTLAAGKWHMSKQPTDRGFDRYFGHLSGATDYFSGDKTFRLNGQPFAVPKEGFYTTDANTDYAIRFIDEAATQPKPFFLYLAYNAPHYPLQAPKEVVEKYIGKYRCGWDELRKRRHARQLELGFFKKPWKLSPRPDDIPAWDSLNEEEQVKEDFRMAVYAAMIDRLDQNIGRLYAHLEKQGVLKDTLILFLSDNGACPFDRSNHTDLKPWQAGSHLTYDTHWAHACNTPFRWYKQNQHEGGISTPLIAHWPAGLKVKAGSSNHQPGHLVDIMATLLDLTGLKYPGEFNGQPLKPLRGISLLPSMRGEERPPHKALYFQFANNRAVRQGNWKLVSAQGGPWELYDMDVDRSELNDLAKEKPELVGELEGLWNRWAAEVGAKAGGGEKKGRR